MTVPRLTPDEEKAISSLNTAMRTIGNEFLDGNGDVALLYAAAVITREAADTLEGIADRWEAERVQDR